MERVIQYISHQLDPTQKRWATIEKETYAIVYCLQKLRSHLWGSKFTILTDHKPLRSLFQNDMANTKIQRWAVLIAESGAMLEPICLVAFTAPNKPCRSQKFYYLVPPIRL